jgi:hypothetical protein
MDVGPTPNRKNPTQKRVLVIAYYWPPAGGPGVQRWLKFVKYLPQHGWTPTVVVPKNAAYPVLDPSLQDDVATDLNVISAPIFEPYEAVLRLLKRRDAERLGSTGNKKSGSINKLMRWLRGNILLPDPRVLWHRPAIRACQAAIHNAASNGAPFDLIITTGPPHSVHLIGQSLKKANKLPWVADFRDPWREMDYLDDFLPTQRTRDVHFKMERNVVNDCDMLLMTSKGIQTSLAVHEVSAEKLCLIPNGWDPEDLPLPSSTAPSPTPHWNMGHFGSLFPIRNAPGLWKAIATWNKRGGQQIHLHFYGVVHPEIKAELSTTLAGCWTDHGYVSHRDAVSAMQQMDTLLMLQNRSKSGRYAIPGKAFEYLALAKPMLIVTPKPSDLDDLATQWGCITIGYDDEREALQKIEALEFQSKPSDEVRMAFTRATLTGQLSEALNKLTSLNP